MPISPTDRPRPSTLADVAKAAGVSIATASYVLANRKDVTISAPTRERVVLAAAELHYRRNALAAALRSGAPREIGLFATKRPHGILADIAFACAEVAGARGLSTALYIGRDETVEPGRVDGVIVLGAGSGGPLHPRLLDGSIPLVEIGSTSTHCQVHADDFGGSRLGVEHLLGLGHRRIAHFAGPQSHPAYQERLRGFLDAVSEAGLRMDATPVIHSEADLVLVLRQAARPTGLLAYNDEVAVLAYRQCSSLGLSVPTDVSIVGFDDESFAGFVDPPLTTLRFAPELMAGSAFALLERQFAREEVPSQTLVPTSLVVRGSTVQRP